MRRWKSTQDAHLTLCKLDCLLPTQSGAHIPVSVRFFWLIFRLDHRDVGEEREQDVAGFARHPPEALTTYR